MAIQGETTPPGRAPTIDFLLHLPTLVRLYWRLLRDPRVSRWPKAMLLGALTYVVLPFDLLPDALPVVGQLDDVVILVVVARWFLRWCPAAIVNEHARVVGWERSV
jgi:uncharacterized membrane protein YkvA (DUF1232 family)